MNYRMSYKKARRFCKYRDCGITDLDKLHMYRFPREEKRCKLWINACCNEKLKRLPTEKLHQNASVCEKHFSDWCFSCIKTKERLIQNAVPGCLTKFMSLELLKESPSDCADNQPVDYRESHSDESCSIQIDSYCSQVETMPPLPSTSDKNQCNMRDKSVQATPTTYYSQVGTMPPLASASDKHQCIMQDRSVQATPTAYSPQEKKLSRLLDNQKRMVRKMREKMSTLEKWKTRKYDALKHQLLKDGINEKAASFIARQVKLNSSKGKSKSFSYEDKLLAYNIMCTSKAAYRILKEVLVLPSESTLRNFVSSNFEKPEQNQSDEIIIPDQIIPESLNQTIIYEFVQ